jgi:nucleoside phosphorylase/tetratricopeptide (TPR) repeat protein
MKYQADILIITITKVESQAVMKVFREATGKDTKPVPIGDRTYHDLGVINGTRVFMALSQMGSGGPGGTQESVRKGIDALQPQAVIMVGIAFGVNEQKQAIGDILVSQQLWLYDLQRVGTDNNGRIEIIPRGDKPHSSTWLFDRFQNADLHWDESKGKVRFGVVMSGDKLVDNVDFREQLKQFEEEAIGGEMEGTGLYVSSHDKKVDWILIKAICDWADGTKAQDKGARQQTAAHNAATFVLHALQQAPLKCDRVPLPQVQRPYPTHVGRWSPEGMGDDNCCSTLPPEGYFVGRDKELDIIASALSPDSRTWGALIDGPGGIGKTALAIKAAHDAPAELFERKIFITSKVRELTAEGEKPLTDFTRLTYLAMLEELGKELGEEGLAKLPPDDRPNSLRLALAGKKSLIIFDNLETLPEDERTRLFQFLSRLPEGNKAIVTSRRRSDVDARILRLDRLSRGEAMQLIEELAKKYPRLQKATDKERSDFYEITHGNPLFIRWIAGQLGRDGSQCRTIAEACAYIDKAPKDNDPLEYIFGDLLKTFTTDEMKVLAALTYFSLPAKLKWIADMTELSERAAETALEDLTDRSILTSDLPAQAYFLPPLTAKFIRTRRPEAVTQTGDALTNRAYALVLQYGGESKDYEKFPMLDAEWDFISAALPRLLTGDNDRLQTVCDQLLQFLNFTGRWDDSLWLFEQAEARALAVDDKESAGYQAYRAGAIYSLRNQPAEVLACATRAAEHWQDSTPRNKAVALNLRGHGHQLEKDYPAAIDAFRKALEIFRSISPESDDVAIALSDLAAVEESNEDYPAAERDVQEALRIDRKNNQQEGVAMDLANLATLALNREQWSEAESLSREALALAEKVGRQELIASDCHLLAKALLKQNHNLDKSLSLSRRAVEIFTRLRQQDNLQEAQEMLAEIEKTIGN